MGSKALVKKRVKPGPRLVMRVIEVKQYITVVLDESKFTPEFMERFRMHFYPFDTTREHAEHIAQLIVRDVSGGKFDPKTGGLDFIEGYGSPAEAGISVDRWGHWPCDTDTLNEKKRR